MLETTEGTHSIPRTSPGPAGIAGNPDELSLYLQEIRNHPLLTAEEEQALGLRILQGDQEAVAQLVTANLRLVVNIAREYSGRGIPLIDLIQEGNIGLIIAASRFDPRLEFRFTTYATKWIRRGIIRTLMDQVGLIRVPTHTAERMRRLLAARLSFLQEQGREPTVAELAGLAQIPECRIPKLLLMMPQISSLDSPMNSEDGSLTLGQALPDTLHAPPLDAIIQTQLQEVIEDLMDRLPEKHRQIIRMRFGIHDGICHTLEEIAQEMNLSKERVRQLEHAAFAKMKVMGKAVGLEDFLVE